MPEIPKRRLVDGRETVPAVYRASLAKAQTRTLRRDHGPVMLVDAENHVFISPFSDVEEEWRWMVLDAFGTRSHQVANMFLNHLLSLCASTFHEGTQTWVPDEDELTAVLHIVAAYRPRNEAEAALAAQIAATHMITMKVAKRAYDYPYDTRTVAAYAKLARTSATQIDTMSGLKGKRRTTRQQITVTHEKHIHHHQHVHVGGGKQKSESQCDATRNDGHDENRSIAGACTLGERPALPGQEEVGRVVPLKSRSGETGVSNARRQERRGAAR